MNLPNPDDPVSNPLETSIDEAQGVPVTITLISAQVIRGYLRWMRAKKCAPTSVATASHILNGLARRAEVHILSVGRKEMRQWQVDRAAELQSGTLHNQIQYIHGFYRWAIEEGLVQDDPSRWLEDPGQPHRLPRPMDDSLFKVALDTAGDDDLRAILGLGRWAGARACEVSRLDWADTHLTGRDPAVRVLGKGSRERVVDICPDLADLLAALPNRTGAVIRRRDGKGGRVTPTRVSQIANDHLRACGITDTYHALRHQFVTRVNDIAGIRAAQEAAGHANPATTAGYAAVSRRKLRQAIIAAAELDIDGGASALP